MTEIDLNSVDLQNVDFDDWDIDIDEIISHYARRGDVEIVRILRDAVDRYKQDMMDADYEPSFSDTSSEDDGDADAVMERLHVQVNPDGFYNLR